MARRPTRKTGILKSRVEDPKTQKIVDAIVERLEILDGIRGDQLDRAVTFRDLADSNFSLLGRAGGGTTIVSPPGGGGGGGGGTDPSPGDIGPAVAPINLTASGTFLAIQLNWGYTGQFVQHFEIWRGSQNSLSDPETILLGTSLNLIFVDYVGGHTGSDPGLPDGGYYYWVRALGTDSVFGPFNDTQGTFGATAIDPSDFEFAITVTDQNLDDFLRSQIELISLPDTGLIDRMTAVEGDIITQDTRVSTLESNYTGLVTSISGNTSLINANSSLIQTNTTQIGTLQTNVGELDGIVNSDSLGNVALSASITSLESSIGALDSEAGAVWEFDADLESWTASANGTLTWLIDGYAQLQITGIDAELNSPTIDVSGAINTQVVMRLRRTVAGSWSGKLQYSTAGHTATGSYEKTIPDPGLVLNEWKTITWDMTTLTASPPSEEDDWINSDITGLKFILDAASTSGTFEIDWVMIARFSTTAVANAISGLATRVEATENQIIAVGIDLTAVEATVNDLDTGVEANAGAISLLTARVDSSEGEIVTQSTRIDGVEADLYVDGIFATSSALNSLSATVSSIDDQVTANAQDVTQLVASATGGYPTVVNPLTNSGFVDGLSQNLRNTPSTSSFVTSFSVGGRTGIAYRIEATTNKACFLHALYADSNFTAFKVEPNAIFEVKFSYYHNRPNNRGHFYFGANGLLDVDVTDGNNALQTVNVIRDKAIVDQTTNPYWYVTRNDGNDDTWVDVTVYLLGKDVDPAICPSRIAVVQDGSADADVILKDGLQVTTDYAILRFLNYNEPPVYGDGLTTTLWVTDVSCRRVDSQAQQVAVLEERAEVNADGLGRLNASYGVRADLLGPDLDGDGFLDPVVVGFGFMADIDPLNGSADSSFQIMANKFVVNNPNNPVLADAPFTVGTATDAQGNSRSVVGIRGDLMLDGTLHGDAIIASTIDAARLNISDLAVITNGVMGTLTSGLIRSGTQNGLRVELEAGFNIPFPLWFGSGAGKSDSNGRFFVENDGSVTVKGLLKAGMIEQSYFTPTGPGLNQFKIATQFYTTPSTYTGGVYTGKKAHLFPMQSSHYGPVEFPGGIPFGGSSSAFKPTTNQCTFLSPFDTSTTEYGRLGQYANMFHFFVSLHVTYQFGFDIDYKVTLFYNYGSGATASPWSEHSFYFTLNGSSGVRSVSPSFSGTFRTKATAFDAFNCWFRVEQWSFPSGSAGLASRVRMFSSSVFTPNIGTADGTIKLLS